MRTKTILLTATLAVAGARSSQAQNVFSQNVVGYVQQTFTPGLFYMISNPLDNGTNDLAGLFTAAPVGSSAQLWNGAGYIVANKGFCGTWKTSGVASDQVIYPGTGLFIQFGGSATVTTTYIGNVPVAIGSTGTNAVSSGTFTYANLIPYADYVTNTATVNLSPILSTGASIQKWNVGLQAFDVYNLGFGGHWIIGGTNNVPQIGVGEGFFLSTSTANSWLQTLPAQ